MNRDEGGLFVFPAAGYQENSGASTFFFFHCVQTAQCESHSVWCAFTTVRIWVLAVFVQQPFADELNTNQSILSRK